jgi:hypothetical protein
MMSQSSFSFSDKLSTRIISLWLRCAIGYSTLGLQPSPANQAEELHCRQT